MNSYASSMMILLVGIVFGIILLILNYNKESEWKNTTKNRLKQLDQLQKSNDINTLKIALFDADKLLNYVLDKYGIKGNTLGDKLKNAEYLIVGKEIKKGQKVSQSKWKRHKRKRQLYNDIWEAHKLRNKLAHEIGTEVDVKELKANYAHLKRGIKSFL